MSHIVVVTGNIGSGKSTVARYLSEKFDCPLLMVDEFSKMYRHNQEPVIRYIMAKHGILEDETPITDLLKKYFFLPEYMDMRKEITDDASSQFWEYVESYDNPNNNVVIVESAIFFETNDSNRCDTIVGVTCSTPVRFERLKNKGYTEEEIIKRLTSQEDERYYKDKCHIVIDTSDNPATFDDVVERIRERCNHARS